MSGIRYRYLLAAGTLIVLAGPALAAESGLNCGQLFAISERAVQFRDQGYSLQQVLNGLQGDALEAKLSADEIQVLRKSVTAVYLGNASIEEIVLACREARGDK
jgi:hypothetical protein